MSRTAFLILLSAVGMASFGCNPPVAKPSAPPPLEVFYVTPTQDEVTEFEEFTGRTAATEMVELRARVSGYLRQIYFTDGADVTEGEPLFRIDALPFVAENGRRPPSCSTKRRAKRLSSQERRSRALFEKQALSQDEYELIKFDLAEAGSRRWRRRRLRTIWPSSMLRTRRSKPHSKAASDGGWSTRESHHRRSNHARHDRRLGQDVRLFRHGRTDGS